MEFIIAPIFFAIALGGMLLALKFSKYKEDDRGCCGGGNCSTDGKKSHTHGSCYHSKLEYLDKNVGKDKNKSIADQIQPLKSV